MHTSEVPGYGFGARERSLGYGNLIACSKAVMTLGSQLGCTVFNKSVPTELWLKEYIDNSVNIVLTQDDIGMDETVEGAVFKEKNTSSLPCKHIYLIYMSNNIVGTVKRIFVLAHELGHILLHSRIINPGMMLNLTSQNWNTESTICKQMEAEANIFSLITLIPDVVIDITSDRLSEDNRGSELVSILGSVLSEVFQEAFPLSLVRDRLLVRKIVGSGPMNMSVDDALDSIRIRSWIGSGTNYLSQTAFDSSTLEVDRALISSILEEIEHRASLRR